MSWEYIAGFLDGEGCIEISKAGDGHGYRFERVRVRISQSVSQAAVLDEIAEFLIDNGYRPTVRTQNPQKKNWQGVVRLTLNRAEDNRRFLTKILPHLRVKQENAKEALAFLSQYKTRRIAA
jgi:hypothetical protein